MVDEYQMMGDLRRGPGYEVTLATASDKARLLLMSEVFQSDGSCGLVEGSWEEGFFSKKERPVPLEEVFAESLLRSPFQGRKLGALAEAHSCCIKC